MRADLHLHTLYSDGRLTPDEVARRAYENGVKLISFTDHDTMANIAEKRAAAQKYGLRSVRGWEISAYAGDIKVHTLGYACGTGAEYTRFLKKCEEGARIRTEIALKKINEICSLRLGLSDVEREKGAADATLHGTHVVRAVASQLNKTFEEVFYEYFAYGRPAYTNACRPTPEEAIEVIHSLGGTAVLAHPARIQGGEGARQELISRLVGCGLDGIECNYTLHTVSETEYYLALAKKHGLLVTGGSDFHFADGRREAGNPVFYADDRLLSRLRVE